MFRPRKMSFRRSVTLFQSHETLPVELKVVVLTSEL
jgi:hypothetical protein